MCLPQSLNGSVLTCRHVSEYYFFPELGASHLCVSPQGESTLRMYLPSVRCLSYIGHGISTYSLADKWFHVSLKMFVEFLIGNIISCPQSSKQLPLDHFDVLSQKGRVRSGGLPRRMQQTFMIQLFKLQKTLPSK